MSVGRGERPFTTPPLDDLAASSFVQPLHDSFVFYAPDAEVLLSAVSAETAGCIRDSSCC